MSRRRLLLDVARRSGLHGRQGAVVASNSTPIAGLCDDVLCMVLRQALAPPATSICKWKRGLALLAVCRRWRAVALPLVYNRIFVVHHGTAHSGRGGMLTRYIGRWLRPKCTTTNAGLAVAGGTTHLAKSVHIAAHGAVPPGAFIQGVAGALRLQTAQWQNVRSAAFEFGAGSMEGTDREYADPKVFVDIFARNMRKVASLDIRRAGQQDGPQCDLPSMLVDAYSNQLVHLSAATELSLQAAQFPSQLTCLRLSMKPLAMQNLPKIDPTPLRHLSLFDVVAKFEWNIFAAAGAGGQLVFPNLVKMSIGYSTADGGASAAATLPVGSAGSDGSECAGVQLRFPVLRRLHVLRCPRDCVLLSAEIYPSRLDRAVIECAPGVGTLEKVNELAPSNALTVVLRHMDDGEMGAYYRATNRLFGTGALANRLSLVLHSKRSVPDPALINWSHLAALTVHAYITTTVLLSLLAKLPNLDQLVATHLISNHRPDEVCVSQHGSLKNAQLGHALSQATHVLLRFVLEPKLSDRDAGFVLYLMAGMPALESLSTTAAMRARLAKLVAKHAGEHPHLQQIRLAAEA